MCMRKGEEGRGVRERRRGGEVKEGEGREGRRGGGEVREDMTSLTFFSNPTTMSVLRVLS